MNRFFVVFWTAWLLVDGRVLFIMRGRAAVLADVEFEARAGGGGGGARRRHSKVRYSAWVDASWRLYFIFGCYSNEHCAENTFGACSF